VSNIASTGTALPNERHSFLVREDLGVFGVRIGELQPARTVLQYRSMDSCPAAVRQPRDWTKLLEGLASRRALGLIMGLSWAHMGLMGLHGLHGPIWTHMGHMGSPRGPTIWPMGS